MPVGNQNVPAQCDLVHVSALELSPIRSFDGRFKPSPTDAVIPATFRVNTSTMTVGWPTKIEDSGASTSPIVTDTWYQVVS